MADAFKTNQMARANKKLAKVDREALLSGQYDLGQSIRDSAISPNLDAFARRDDIIPIPLEDDNRRRAQSQRQRARRSSTGYQSTLLTETLG